MLVQQPLQNVVSGWHNGCVASLLLSYFELWIKREFSWEKAAGFPTTNCNNIRAQKLSGQQIRKATFVPTLHIIKKRWLGSFKIWKICNKLLCYAFIYKLSSSITVLICRFISWHSWFFWQFCHNFFLHNTIEHSGIPLYNMYQLFLIFFGISLEIS